MPKNQNNAAKIASQLAAGAAQIIKGALSGGLYGAVVAGVKAFLPQLIKLAAILTIALLCLPSILFFCLPSSMYGFPSVSNSSVIEQTNLAQDTEALYAQTRQLVEAAVLKVQNEKMTGYDDYKVYTNLNGIDNYWITAIASVLHSQELSTINKAAVNSIVEKSITSTSREEIYYEKVEVPKEKPSSSSQSSSSSSSDSEVEEETEIIEVERKRLHLSIGVMQAEELMNILGFSDFQKQWARSIHSTIYDYQLNGSGGDGIDIGDVTFTDASIPVVYFNQQDERWNNKLYAGSTIGVAGCGPTTMAMVVSTLTDKTVNPEEMAFWAELNGHACNGNGSYHSIVPAIAEQYSLNVKRAGASNGQEIVDALASGKLVVAIMGPGNFTDSGHFLLLRGVTKEGKILVADSYTYSFCNKEWDLSLIMAQTNKSASAGGPIWII